MSFYLWGTGVFAKRIQEFLHRFYGVFPQYTDDFLDLGGVLDRSPSKQGEIFEKCVVNSPDSIDWKHFTGCVIVALKFPEEVVDYLVREGVTQKQFFLISDFFVWFCEKAYMTLNKAIKKNPKTFSSEQRQYIENLSFAYQIIEYCNKEQFEELFGFLEKNTEQMPLAAGVLDVCLGQSGVKKFYEAVHDKKVLDKAKPKRFGIYYARYYSGGVERVMSYQIPALIDLGYEVVLFLDERDITKEYPIPKDVECVTLGKKDLGALAWYRNLCEALDSIGIDIFYSHAYLTDAPMLPWLANSYGIRLCAQIHTTFYSLLNSNFETFKVLYSKAEKVAVLSRVDALFWQTMGIDGRCLFNPVEDVREKTKERIKSTVLWCGRIEQYQKRVLDIVPIIAEVKKQIPDIKLIVVGGTDQPRVLQKLEELIKNNSLTDNIILQGYTDDISSYYKSAKICLMTSRFEGFPMVLAEALNYGMPVVMYDLPYLEMVRECRGIEKVPVRDIKQAAEKIVWLLRDEKAWLEHFEEVKASLHEFREKHDYKKLLHEFLLGTEHSRKDIFSEEDYRILVLTLLSSKLNPISWDYPV